MNRYICNSFGVHASVGGLLCSFRLLVIINSAAVNIMEHVSLLHAWESSGYMPRSGIAGSSGRIMSRFLMSFQTDFSELLYQFAIHKQLRSIPLFIHLSQQLLSTGFLMLVILNYGRWNFKFVWFAFPWWLRLLTISLAASHLFYIPQVKILLLAL